jgi:hypothetical protein
MKTTAEELLQALQLLSALEQSSAKNDAIAFHGFAITRAQNDLKQLLLKYAPHPFVHWRLCRPLIPPGGRNNGDS